MEISIEQIIIRVIKEAESLIFGSNSARSHFLELKRTFYTDSAGNKRSIYRGPSGEAWWELVAYAHSISFDDSIVVDYSRIQTKDYTSPFDLFMDVLRLHLETAIGGAQSKLAQVISNEEKKHRNRFAAAVKVRYGIDVNTLMTGQETRALIENAVKKSVTLIRGLSNDLAKQVEFTILDAAQRRQSRTTLSERLRHVMGITRKRARLIAKDQTASFNGALNQARQTQIGVDRYVWETMEDERVRHEHAKRHGKIFKWSDPPEDGHPGEPINCRCTAIPFIVQRGYKDASYTRDEFVESEHPRSHGKFTNKAESEKKQPWWMRVKSHKPKRVWNGNPVPIKTVFKSKDESGKIGERAIVQWLKDNGIEDARPVNHKLSNFPVDIVGDHLMIEAKTSLVSNGPKNFRWVASIGEPSKAEKAILAKLSPEEKAKRNAEKYRKIIERKLNAVADYEKEVGQKIKPLTMTTILNPDTKSYDLFIFEGFHLRISWNSEEAKNAYVGTFTYE